MFSSLSLRDTIKIANVHFLPQLLHPLLLFSLLSDNPASMVARVGFWFLLPLFLEVDNHTFFLAERVIRWPCATMVVSWLTVQGVVQRQRLLFHWANYLPRHGKEQLLLQCYWDTTWLPQLLLTSSSYSTRLLAVCQGAEAMQLSNYGPEKFFCAWGRSEESQKISRQQPGLMSCKKVSLGCQINYRKFICTLPKKNSCCLIWPWTCLCCLMFSTIISSFMLDVHPSVSGNMAVFLGTGTNPGNIRQDSSSSMLYFLPKGVDLDRSCSTAWVVDHPCLQVQPLHEHTNYPSSPHVTHAVLS